MRSPGKLSMSMEKGTVYGLLLGLAPTVIGVGLFLARWGPQSIRESQDHIAASGLAFVLGIVAHELIHGVTWVVAGRAPWSAIRFGVMWQALTPYCHVTVPITSAAFRAGALMPLIVLGLVPLGVAIATGWGWLVPFGALLTLGAGGDLLAVWLLRGVPGDALVEDHPSEVGCRLVEPAPGAEQLRAAS